MLELQYNICWPGLTSCCITQHFIDKCPDAAFWDAWSKLIAQQPRVLYQEVLQSREPQCHNSRSSSTAKTWSALQRQPRIRFTNTVRQILLPSEPAVARWRAPQGSGASVRRSYHLCYAESGRVTTCSAIRYTSSRLPSSNEWWGRQQLPAQVCSGVAPDHNSVPRRAS